MDAKRDLVSCYVCDNSGIDAVYMCHECQLMFCSGCSVQHMAAKPRPHTLLRLATSDDSTTISQLIMNLNLNEESDCSSDEMEYNNSTLECSKTGCVPATEDLVTCINDKQFGWEMQYYLAYLENLTIDCIKESFKSTDFLNDLMVCLVNNRPILNEQEAIARCMEFLLKHMHRELSGPFVHTVDMATQVISNVKVTKIETGTQTGSYVSAPCTADGNETTHTTQNNWPESQGYIDACNVEFEAGAVIEEDTEKVSESMANFASTTMQRYLKPNIGTLKPAEPSTAVSNEHETATTLADNDEGESNEYETGSAKRKKHVKIELNRIQHQYYKNFQLTEVRRNNLTSKLKHSKYTGLVRLDNGGYVLADERTCCLVLLTESFQMKSKLKFDPPAKPWNLLKTGYDAVVCSLRYEDDYYDQIALIKISKCKMKIWHKIDLPYECFCVQQLPNSNMLVSARNDIGNWLLLELTPKGKIRRKLTTVNGKNIEAMKRFVVTQSSDRKCLLTYTCALNNKQCIFKTIDLDRHSFSTFTYKTEARFKAGDFCFDGQGVMYVCNKMDQTVHVLTQSGLLQGVFDCIGQPSCLHVDGKTLTIVSSDGYERFIQDVHVG